MNIDMLNLIAGGVRLTPSRLADWVQLLGNAITGYPATANLDNIQVAIAK